MGIMDKIQNNIVGKSDRASQYVQATALASGALCGLYMLLERGHRILGVLTAGSAAVAGASLCFSLRSKTQMPPIMYPETASVDAPKPALQQEIGEEQPSPSFVEPLSQGGARMEPNAEVASLCVLLYDELDQNFEFFDEEKRQLAEHVMARLEDILIAGGSEVIRDETEYNRLRHQPDKITNNGAVIAETLSPGFALGRKILRRARVRIAEFNDSIDKEPL